MAVQPWLEVVSKLIVTRPVSEGEFRNRFQILPSLTFRVSTTTTIEVLKLPLVNHPGQSLETNSTAAPRATQAQTISPEQLATSVASDPMLRNKPDLSRETPNVKIPMSKENSKQKSEPLVYLCAAWRLCVKSKPLAQHRVTKHAEIRNIS